jgi:excinuclease ABC subunit A
MADLKDKCIHIKGAREHNLKNLEIRIPHGKLVVVTGVSGSGKSSLAFDTIYAEGYRKYMDSLSLRARQLLEQIRRPQVDFIEGLSPVIAIEQHQGGHPNPRSTVASVTEVADYARLLWAFAGEAFCPKDGKRIVQRTLDQCVERLFQEPLDSRVQILAPCLTARSTLIRDELPRLRQQGFQRIRINGIEGLLDDPNSIKLPSGTAPVQLDLIIDRLILKPENRSRIADSLELAFKIGLQQAIVLHQRTSEDPEWQTLKLSQTLSCECCHTPYEPLSPALFSHNRPEGACPRCSGLGKTTQFAPELVIPDPSKSVRTGAIKPWRLGSKRMIIQHNAILKQLAEQMPFDPTLEWKELPEDTKKEILYGNPDRLYAFKLKAGKAAPVPQVFEGVLSDLEKMFRETSSDGLRHRLMTYQISDVCPECHGHRLNNRVDFTFVLGTSFGAFMQQSIASAWELLRTLKAKSEDDTDSIWFRSRDVICGLENRLRFLNEVGLGYLQLSREFNTLSGGECQRARLATQLGMGLVGVVYVLDEPTIGLHPEDNERLIQTLTDMRDRGNAVVIVEHDADMIRIADHLIELGPGAGEQGGHLIFEGKPAEAAASTRSLTGRYLSGAQQVLKEGKTLKPSNGFVTIHGATENNLKLIDVGLPIGLMTCVAGVSGSGKSTLINDILGAAASRRLHRAKVIPGKHTGITGLDAFRAVVTVDQSPIGQSPRSNPATYTKLFDLLRTLLAQCPLSKIRGYTASRFSYNVRGGRCERCQGDGVIKMDMHFLNDIYTECPSCQGLRYNRETLEVKYKGKHIAEILNLSVDEACAFFRSFPKIMEKLDTLQAVGLGYLKLGQAANTLSGGEAQRLKLSLELSRKQTGETLYLLDEPTTGLHWADIQNLLDLLIKLRDRGNTIVVIEHNVDMIRNADWILELGPEGGERGGEILFNGPISTFRTCAQSRTARFLPR